MKLLDKHSFIIDHSAAKGKQFNDKIREKTRYVTKAQYCAAFWEPQMRFLAIGYEFSDEIGRFFIITDSRIFLDTDKAVCYNPSITSIAFRD